MHLRQQGYWDHHYEEELKNFEADGDEGEIWFGKGLTRKIVSYICERVNSEDYSTKILSVADIGCGNAFLLTTLMCELKLPNGSFNFLGLDYSHNSIELSRKIVRSKGIEDKIDLRVCDFLNKLQLVDATGGKKFDFVIDKGTFDAICLMASSSDHDLSEARERYVESLETLVTTGTKFILASCNHTQDELLALLHGAGNQDSVCIKRKYQVIDRIETPKLQFGGREGSQVCCLIIQFD